MITSETQYKISNLKYRVDTIVFTIALEIVCCVVFFLSMNGFPAIVNKYGIPALLLLFQIPPLLFLIVRLLGKVTSTLTDKHLMFHNYILFLTETYKINASEIASVAPIKIKKGDYGMDFFSNRLFTYKKILYISGNDAVKLYSKLVENDTIIMGTQKSDEWISAFHSRGIEIKKDEAGREEKPVPKVQKKPVPSTAVKN